jgi:hypothetical protein
MADEDALRNAGIDLSSFSDDEQTALKSLTDEEVDTLASIRAKLDGQTTEEARNTGNIVW